MSYYPIENIEAERAVIGCILSNAEKAMPEAMLSLDYSDFSEPWYANVFKACCAYFKENKSIDVVTIASYFGTLDDAKQKMVEAHDLTPSFARYSDYIRIVSECSRLRRAQYKASEIVAEIENGCALNDCLNMAGDLQRTLELKQDKGAVSAEQGVNDFWERKDQKPEYITTGFSNIDKSTYIRKGNYIVVGARSSVGKTAFTLQLMLHMAKTHRVAYFSLETGAETIFERLVACYTNTSMTDIKNRAVKNWQSKKELLDELKELNFEIVEAAGYNIEQIRAKAIQLNADIIFIDYLGLIQGTGRTIYEKTTQISMDIHTMAQQLNKVVFALVQLNRETEHSDKRPTMANLRDSGQIEQDADIIMLLHKPDDKNKELRELIICKNKEGKTGFKPFKFDGDKQKFTPIYGLST